MPTHFSAVSLAVAQGYAPRVKRWSDSIHIMHKLQISNSQGSHFQSVPIVILTASEKTDLSPKFLEKDSLCGCVHCSYMRVSADF